MLYHYETESQNEIMHTNKIMIKSLDVAQIEIDELKIAIYARAIIKITRLAKDSYKTMLL